MLDRTDHALIPRATVEDIVRLRNRALLEYDRAYIALASASEAQAKAADALRQASPAERTAMNYHSKIEESKWIEGIKMVPRADYVTTARRLVDTSVWAHIVGITDLERLMDKQAKEELRQQLMTDPPEVTVDNVFATLEQFAADAGMIFKRGIANCFSKLDRRFRSHDGWKIGSRVVLTHMFDHNGWWNYHRDMESVLMDIERTFLVLDEQPVPPSYSGIVGALRNARTVGLGAHQTMVESDFFRVRAFKNGNCHVWFKRDDLLKKVNRLLGEYYGAPIPDEREATEDPFANPKTALAKGFAFFPSPQGVVDRVIDRTPLSQRDGEPRKRVLEPSAGTGNLARACVAKGAKVDCIEVQPKLAAQLVASGLYGKVIAADFLLVQPDPANLYDTVVMNPPFDLERDIDHVMHALKFLKPEGYLVSVMSAGTEFRETKKAAAFRDLMSKMKAHWDDLPANSFSSVGTNVNTVLLRVFKDGRHFYR